MIICGLPVALLCMLLTEYMTPMLHDTRSSNVGFAGFFELLGVYIIRIIKVTSKRR